MATLTGTRPDPGVVSTSVAQARSRPDDDATNAHRQLIGYIGLLLPLILVGLVIIRDGLTLWRGLESVSAYYYTGAVAAFVGMLVALALYLFPYKGYRNPYNWADQAAAKIAAAAAVVVALYPTKAPDAVLALTWWRPWMGKLHYVAAIVLFAMFAVFALWLFRLTAPGEQATADKRLRNHLYLGCGVAIVACIAWAGFNALNDRPIFWPEAVALVAFALSWLVKGYAHRTIARALFGS
jgi:hypothetical protein